VFPIIVSTDHSAIWDIDCHSAAGTTDIARSSCAGGTDHDSPDWVVPGTSAGSLAEDWCVDGYYFQRPVPEASS